MELQTIKADISKIIKESNELIQLESVEQTKKHLQSIAEKYSGTLVTVENYDEGKEIRKTIRDYRYGLQNIAKHNSKILNDAKAENTELMNELISIIRPVEDEIHEQIKQVEEEKERIKKQKEQEELQRIAEINKQINETRSELSALYTYASNSTQFEIFSEILSKLKNDIDEDKFQEFTFEASNLHSEFSDLLPEMKQKISEKEIEILNDHRKAKLADVWDFIPDKTINFGKLTFGEFVKIEEVALEAKRKHDQEEEAKRLEEQRLREKELEDQERIRQKLEAEKKELQRQREEFERVMEEARVKQEREEAEKRRIQEEAEKEARERKMEEERIEAEKAEREILKKECAKFKILISGKTNDQLKQEIQEEKDRIDEQRKKELQIIGKIYLDEVDRHFHEVHRYFDKQEDIPEVYESDIEAFRLELDSLLERFAKRLMDI